MKQLDIKPSNFAKLIIIKVIYQYIIVRYIEYINMNVHVM